MKENNFERKNIHDPELISLFTEDRFGNFVIKFDLKSIDMQSESSDLKNQVFEAIKNEPRLLTQKQKDLAKRKNIDVQESSEKLIQKALTTLDSIYFQNYFDQVFIDVASSHEVGLEWSDIANCHTRIRIDNFAGFDKSEVVECKLNIRTGLFQAMFIRKGFDRFLLDEVLKEAIVQLEEYLNQKISSYGKIKLDYKQPEDHSKNTCCGGKYGLKPCTGCKVFVKSQVDSGVGWSISRDEQLKPESLKLTLTLNQVKILEDRLI